MKYATGIVMGFVAGVGVGMVAFWLLFDTAEEMVPVSVPESSLNWGCGPPARIAGGTPAPPSPTGTGKKGEGPPENDGITERQASLPADPPGNSSTRDSAGVAGSPGHGQNDTAREGSPSTPPVREGGTLDPGEVRYKGRSIEQWIRGLRDLDEDFRDDSACALGNIGRAAVPALIEAMEDKETRYHAVQALSDIGPDAKEAIPHLASALEDEDPGIREMAASALGYIGHPSCAPSLVRALEYGDPGMRKTVLDALGNTGMAATDAVPMLVDLLRDEDVEVCLKAAGALGKIGPDAVEAVPALLQALKRKDVRLFPNAAWKALVAIGPPAVPELIEELKTEVRYRKGNIASILGEIGPGARDAVPFLVEALKDPEAAVRADAVKALGRIGREGGVPVQPLKEVLGDENFWVRLSAAFAFIQLCPEKAELAVPPLVEALNRKDFYHKSGVKTAETLGKLGGKARSAVPALEEAAKNHEYGLVRAAARMALKRIEGE